MKAQSSERCCNRVFISGLNLTDHYRKKHPKKSMQGYEGNLSLIRNKKLRNRIFRKKKKIKQNRPYTKV